MRLCRGLSSWKQKPVTLAQLGYSQDQISRTEESFSQHLKKPREGMSFGEKSSLPLTIGTISPREAYDMLELRNNSNLLHHLEALALRDYCQVRIYSNQGQLWSNKDWDAWDAHGYTHARVGYLEFFWWIRGTTPDKHVNRAMRRVKATGHLCHEERLLLVRYFIDHVRRPWQEGADHFSSLFADHDDSFCYYFWMKEACRYEG